MGEKLSKVALDAADKSIEISTKWTKETLAKMGDLTAVKNDAADYTKAMTDFASAQAELAAENMAAFAEVAKKVQMDTVELMLAAGKDMGDEARPREEGHRRRDQGRQKSDRRGEVNGFPDAGVLLPAGMDEGRTRGSARFRCPVAIGRLLLVSALA